MAVSIDDGIEPNEGCRASMQMSFFLTEVLSL